MSNNLITFKTSSPSGDLISFLSGIRQIWLDTGLKAVIYHRLGMIGSSYPGSVHPYEDESQNPICFNQYAFDMMKPLLLSQEYIEDYLVFTGQEHQYDLDRILQETFTNKPLGSLNRWLNYAFPQMTTDLSKEWIKVSPIEIEDRIVINFTQRHRNTFVNYFFLKQHQDKIVFAGLEKERELFCKEFDLDIPLLDVDDFYELAQIIKGCKFFMGNQSFCFQIAESIKVPRILEVFPMMPNVIPVGEKAYDFYGQQSLEYCFNKLLNEVR